MQFKKNIQINVLTAVSFVAVLAVPACNGMSKPELRSATEVYVGGGRACAGKFILNANTISWVTPFSQCESQPYNSVALATVDEKNRLFSLRKPSAKCLYSFINLKVDSETGQIQVTGFKKIEDFEQKKFDDALICPVVRQ